MKKHNLVNIYKTSGSLQKQLINNLAKQQQHHKLQNHCAFLSSLLEWLAFYHNHLGYSSVNKVRRAVNNTTHTFLQGTSFKGILTHEKWETSVTFSDIRIKKLSMFIFYIEHLRGVNPYTVYCYLSLSYFTNQMWTLTISSLTISYFVMTFSFNSTMLAIDWEPRTRSGLWITFPTSLLYSKSQCLDQSATGLD